MTSLVLVLRLLLALVFAVASFAKQRDRVAFQDTVAAFGVPLRLARPAALGILSSEAVVAVGLLFQPTARWAALAACLLLLTFIGGIAHALSQGLTPDCNCFGQLSAEQIGPKTLVRNGALLLAAGFTVWKAPGSSLAAWTSSLTAANVVASIAVIGFALAAFVALDYRRRLAGALEAAGSAAAGEQAPESGLVLGQLAPAFELNDLHGDPVSLDSLREAGLPLALVFASPTCAPCSALLPELVRWGAALDERLRIVVIESGVPDGAAVAEFLPGTGELRVLVEPERKVQEAYGVHGTPTGLVIDSAGAVATELALGAGGIEAMIRELIRTAPETRLAAQRG